MINKIKLPPRCKYEDHNFIPCSSWWIKGYICRTCNYWLNIKNYSHYKIDLSWIEMNIKYNELVKKLNKIEKILLVSDKTNVSDI